MKTKVTLVAAVVTLGLLVPIALAISFGQVDQANQFPNVGAVVVALPGSEPYVACSGTLIHPRVFLTAGHATIYANQHPEIVPYSYISFAVNALDPSTWHRTVAAITHPDYDPVHNQVCNDVGVVILEDPIDDLPLVNLPYAGFLDDLKKAKLLREPGQGGTPFTIVGYGGTLDWPPPAVIPADGLRRFAYSDFAALTPGWLYKLENPATGNGGNVLGDSGGPAFWVDADGTLINVALTGHGGPNCVGTNVAWRVDIPATLDFITWVLAQVDAGS